MNGMYLCLPVFLPIVAGMAGYLIKFGRESTRRLYYGVVICLTTALAWIAILRCDGSSFTLLQFTDKLTLALRMDGAARIFAGLSATLWPFTMVYAYDYMKHEGHLAMFWAFFTASFGVTLGIAFAANMMTMYLFYELLTLATLPLVMQPMTKKAVRAGVKYAVYSMAGAALAFIGLVFLIVQDAQDFTMGGHLAGYDGNISLLLSVFVLSFVGFGVKARVAACRRCSAHTCYRAAPRRGRGQGRRLCLHPPDLLCLRHRYSARYPGAVHGDGADADYHSVRLVYVRQAAALQAPSGLFHRV